MLGGDFVGRGGAGNRGKGGGLCYGVVRGEGGERGREKKEKERERETKRKRKTERGNVVQLFRRLPVHMNYRTQDRERDGE